MKPQLRIWKLQRKLQLLVLANSGVKVEKAVLETKTSVTGQGTITEATGSGARDSIYERTYYYQG